MPDPISHLKGAFLEGLSPLDRSRILPELVAGCVMAAIFIPEVMGYAQIAGMPIITGVYTILLPMAVFALFCSSRHMIVGADSATAAILFGILVTLAVPESPEYVAMASSVAILCALFLIVARLFNLGFIGDFLSRTALVGFLTGVGIQVAIGQLSAMFGLSPSGNNTVPPLLNFISRLPETSIQTLMVSASVVAVILISRRISRKIPGALIAVVGTIIAGFLLDFSTRGISVVGTVPKGIPTLDIPFFSVQDLPILLTAAGACFIVIIAQSTATARAYSVKCSDNLNPDKDILGLGLANLTAGLTGTFVVNGSPTKTQIAVDSGARSQLATLATAAITLLVIIFLTKPLSYLPNATLATIVFLIGVEMVNVAGLKDIFHEVPSEFVLALITLLTVVMISVLWGIIVSVILSLLLHLSHSYRPNNSILIRNERGEWEFASIAPGRYTKKGLIVYRFNRDLYYANADKLMHEVIELVKTAEDPVEWVVLDSGGFSAIDYTSIQMLKELKHTLDTLHVTFCISSVLPGLKEQFERFGLIQVFGADNLYKNVYDAMEAFENRK